MKTLLVLFLFGQSASAVSPAMCSAMCAKINAGKKMHCGVATDYGFPLLFLDIPKWGKGQDPDLTLQSQALTECFFAAKGQVMQIQGANDSKHVMICQSSRQSETGYLCHGADVEDAYQIPKSVSEGRKREKR